MAAGKKKNLVSKTAGKLLYFFRRADMLLLALCVLASVYGIILISSAGRPVGAWGYLRVQILSLILGIVIFIIFSLLDFEHIARAWPIIIIFNIVFIGCLHFLGVDGGSGNQSWLSFSWLPFSIQPAEVVKVTFTILLAKHFHSFKGRINRPIPLFTTVLHAVFMVCLIVFCSSDYGSALVYLFIYLFVALAAGVSFWWYLAAAAFVAVALPLLIKSDILRQDQIDRVMIIFDPSIDPTNQSIGWQAAQSKIALGSGGIFGQGLYQGTQTQSGAIPAQHTDFIFSVCGEELGMVGCIGIIVLLLAIIARCIHVGVKCKKPMSAMMCFGIAGMLIFQTFENIFMCMGLFPVIGLTLPFFSYGGSSMIALFMAMGVVSSVKMKPTPGLSTKKRGYQ
ncbi:MAG: rod shape-determining protein RodA [Oscillospiraceae bacterium]|nr:rod shape-determining protein RodA [Oscillospiraceae bacterium]